MIYITIGLDARNIYIDNIISKTDKDIFYFDENSFQDFLNEVNTESLFKIPSLLILKNANKIKNIAKILENLNNDNINDIIIDFNTNKLNKEFSYHFSKFKTIEVLDDILYFLLKNAENFELKF